MNTKKGFTLFTALISLILVSISLALVFNMIATEETYLSLIQDQASMSDLITMGDLAKADAFNSFLISLRSTWEDRKSHANFVIDRADIDKNWTQFADDFVKRDFFEQNFAGYFANSLYHQLSYKQNPPGYAITIKKDIGTEQENGQLQSDNFNKIIEQIFKDGGEKVDVVDCDQVDDHCSGSFYLTLDTTKISDENYEKLPIITVLRYKNNQVIQRPILNRQVYKIYIPWRGFQAFRVARRMALGAEEEKENFPTENNTTGLFKPELHNTLEQARLGFCDPGTCSPRPSFFQTPNTTGFNKKCNLVDPVDLEDSFVPSYLQTNITGGSYDPKDPQTMKAALQTFYVAVFQEHLPQNSSYSDTGLIMEGTQIENNDINYIDVNVSARAKETKQIIEDSVGNPGNYPQSQFSSISDISGKAGGLGIYFNNETKSSKYIYQENLEWHNLHKDKSVGPNSSIAQVIFNCVELDYIDIHLRFIEENPKYYIRPEYEGKKVQMNIILRDTYTDFYFPRADGWPGLGSQNGYISGMPQNLEENWQENWTCYTAILDGQKCGVVNN